MEAHHFWAVFLAKMAFYRIAHLFVQRLNGVRLGEDRLTHSPRGIAPIGRILNQKNKFGDGLDPFTSIVL